MARITYLLGAGASANCLPVVSQVNMRLKAFTDEYVPTLISQFGDTRFPGRLGESVGDFLRRFKEDMRWLRSELVSTATFDTLAKSFLIQKRDSDLNKIKALLSIYFLIEQARLPADPRYSLFWASLISRDFEELGNNTQINIISWNYDSQIEKTLLPLSRRSSILSLNNMLQIRPIAGASQDLDVSRFSVVKLNGSAGLHSTTAEGLKKIDEYITWNISADLLDKLSYFYAQYVQSPDFLRPQLNFAWEDNETSREMLKLAKATCQDTEVLICIGYSFPYFNREIDREILSAMSKLRQVILQVGPTDGASVRDRVSSYLGPEMNIQVLQDIGYFYIPYEL